MKRENNYNSHSQFHISTYEQRNEECK